MKLEAIKQATFKNKCYLYCPQLNKNPLLLYLSQGCHVQFPCKPRSSLKIQLNILLKRGKTSEKNPFKIDFFKNRCIFLN